MILASGVIGVGSPHLNFRYYFLVSEERQCSQPRGGSGWRGAKSGRQTPEERVTQPLQPSPQLLCSFHHSKPNSAVFRVIMYHEFTMLKK